MLAAISRYKNCYEFRTYAKNRLENKRNEKFDLFSCNSKI